MRKSDLRSWVIAITIFFGAGLSFAVFLFLNKFIILGLIALIGVIYVTWDVVTTIILVNKEQKQNKTEHSEDD